MARELKTILYRIFRPLMPGWPDDARRIIQRPHLEALLARASSNSSGFPCVLNAGAGEGGYSGLLLKLPGVESLIETDYGWSTAPPRRDSRQEFFCSSLVSIPAASRSFDLVLCTEVLEHIREHEQALDEIARVATPGGWVLITVPTPPAPPDPAHVREGYRPEELASMLRQRGFEVVDQKFCMHFFFRFILANWPRWRRTPRFAIQTLAYLDRLFPVGPPMDLMMLARLEKRPAVPVARETAGAAAAEGVR